MASRAFMTAFLVVMGSIGGLYIFMATFGGAMDAMYVNFNSTLPNYALPVNWNTVATKTLTYWQYFYRSVTIIVIALGIWLLRVAFVDVDYQRPQ